MNFLHNLVLRIVTLHFPASVVSSPNFSSADAERSAAPASREAGNHRCLLVWECVLGRRGGEETGVCGAGRFSERSLGKARPAAEAAPRCHQGGLVCGV